MVRALSNPNEPSARAALVYTPCRATKTLPFLRRIIQDLIRLSVSIDTQREQLRGLDNLPETMEQAPYKEELSDMRLSLEKDQQKLQSCLGELTLLGVAVHDPFDGFVDFPAMLNRRPVQLCWQPADEQVEYWHELDQTPSDRKKWDSAKSGC